MKSVVYHAPQTHGQTVSENAYVSADFGNVFSLIPDCTQSSNIAFGNFGERIFYWILISTIIQIGSP